MSRKAKLTELSDGRTLGYDEHGPADGMPVLCFHGAPSNRGGLGMFGEETLADRLGIHIIAGDRPGSGFPRSCVFAL